MHNCKNFILLILLISIITFNSYSQYELKTHYNTVSHFLKFAKIDSTNINLYGHNGANLLSSDNGESWRQNYSGTRAIIYEQISYNGKVYAINSDNELMISEDKGDHWKFNKLKFKCVDFEIYQDTIYIISKDMMYFKSLNDSEFKEIQLEIDEYNKPSLKHIQIFSNLLIITDEMSRILEFKRNQSKLNIILQVSMFSDRTLISNDYIIFTRGKKIAIVNKNFVYNIYEYKTLNNWEEVEYAFMLNNEIYILTFNKDTLLLYKYDKIQNNFSTLVASYKCVVPIISMFVSTIINRIYDVMKNGEKLYISISNKQLLEYNISNRKFSEVFCYPPYLDYKMVGNPNFLLVQDSIIYQSFDGGKIFHSSKVNFLDSIKGLNLRFRFKTDDDNFFYIFNYKFNNGGRSIVFFSDKYGNNFEPILNLPNSSPDFFLKEKNNYLYLSVFENTGSWNVSNSESIWKINISTKECEKIKSFDNSEGGIQNVNIKGIDYFIFNKRVEGPNFEISQYFFKSTDNFKTIDTLFYFKDNNRRYFVYKYDDNIIILGKQLLYNIKENKFINIEDSTLFTVDFKYNDITFKYDKLSDLIVMQREEKMIGLNSYIISNYVKIRLTENKFEVDTLGTSIVDSRTIAAIYNFDKLIYFLNIGSHFYVPIEEDRLEYYTSVRAEGGPPAIWTYPPYPNPVNGKVKMKFYSAIMNELGKLKVELVEISTGKRYEINKYNLSATSDYWGEIEFDLTNFNRGAYLLNFKICNTNRSESIIIE